MLNIFISFIYPDRLIALIKFNKVVPAVNQVETHVFNQQINAQGIIQKYGVQIQAWAPFAQGKNNLFSNETLKVVAQVALRYLIQRCVSVIPKSQNSTSFIQVFAIAAVDQPAACKPKSKNQSENGLVMC